MTPAQALEAGEVAIGGDPLATGLDREGSEVGIGHERAARPTFPAEAREDSPVPRSGTYRDATRLRKKLLA